jgi:Leucine-rich repeat (LRR) protein
MKFLHKFIFSLQFIIYIDSIVISAKNIDDLTLRAAEQDECPFIGCICKNGPEEDEIDNRNKKLKNKSTTKNILRNDDYENETFDVNCPDFNATKLKEFPQRLENSDIIKIGNLDMSQNEIKMIPSGQLKNLEIDLVDFSQNLLESISNDAFAQVYFVNTLDLSNNLLESLSVNTFEPIKYSLKHLAINSNRLGKMDSRQLSKVLSKITNLKTLRLNHNRIEEMPDFTELINLEEIGLSNNFIEKLTISQQDESIRLLPSSLISLVFEANHLKTIDDSTLSNLVNLKFLNLASNQISKISSNAFIHLTQLTQINLAKNYIKHIPSRLIFKQSMLERIDLSDQNQMLKSLDDYSFEREMNQNPIRRIDLSNNRISKIASKAFCTSRVLNNNGTNAYMNIKHLDISGNQLTSVLSACLWRQLSLGYNMSEEKQTKVSFKSFDDIQKKIQPIIKCDCEIKKSGYYVDLEGECVNQNGIPVLLNQYKCTRNNDFDTYDETEETCSFQFEFDCKNTDENTIYDWNKTTTKFYDAQLALNKKKLNIDTTTPVQRWMINEDDDQDKKESDNSTDTVFVNKSSSSYQNSSYINLQVLFLVFFKNIF